MRVFHKFLICMFIILAEWITLIVYSKKKNLPNMFEIAMSFPGLFFLTVCYYALCNICYSILFIGDCEGEKEKLMNDIKEGEEFFKSKGIKYN